MSDQKRGMRALDALLPPSIRADFWAVVRIVDRTLSAALRGLVLQGIAVGSVTYLGIELLNRFGSTTVEYVLLAAVAAGLMELIPDIGPFLWATIVGVIGFSTSPSMGVELLGTYAIGRWLVHRLLVSQIEQRVTRNVHPALMVVAVVALSEFGILWLFLATPIVVIGWDLLRYVHGRVGSPPRPAGLLPGEPLPVSPEVTKIPARQASRRRRLRRSGATGQ
jgi:predicted PurR-regulated permease PerM